MTYLILWLGFSIGFVVCYGIASRPYRELQRLNMQLKVENAELTAMLTASRLHFGATDESVRASVVYGGWGNAIPTN